jgi:hypothetical protein
MMVWQRLEASADACGLDLRGGFRPEPADEVPAG